MLTPCGHPQPHSKPTIQYHAILHIHAVLPEKQQVLGYKEIKDISV